MTELEDYIERGLSAGCTSEQMQNFVQAGVVLQPRQLAASAAARLCDRADGPTAVGYGGARGGGKSHWLLAQMGADDCQRVRYRCGADIVEPFSQSYPLIYAAP